MLFEFGRQNLIKTPPGPSPLLPQQTLQQQNKNKPARCSAGARGPPRSSASSPPPAAVAPSAPRSRSSRALPLSRQRRWRRRSRSPCRRTGGRGVTRTTGCAIPPTRTSRLSSPRRTPMPTPSSARLAAAASARASPPRCAPGCPLPPPHRPSRGALGSYLAASLLRRLEYVDAVF